ncbi:MAG TPA: hypothetical protein VGS01_08935 [Candidatus Limnocylindria bacterium]|nr:hypothetical protein [Candidatus Limnocylindria bacterium]
MKVFSTLLMATIALALFLVASASAATVGGGTAVTSPNGPDEFGRAWAACLETGDANSDECYRAQELSGLGPDEFFDKLNRKLDFLAEQPKPETRPDAWAQMKECAGTRDLESDACRRFVESTGLGGDEVAHLADGLASPRGEQQATADKKSGTSEMTDTMKACVDLRSEMKGGKSVEQLTALAEKINSLCPKAIRESRMTPGQFWAKFAAYR